MEPPLALLLVVILLVAVCAVLYYFRRSISERFLRRLAEKEGDMVVYETDSETHSLQREDKALIKSVIHYGEKSVGDVMTPRIDTTTLDMSDSYETVIKTFIENKYSRIPVFDETDDKVHGMLYIKDLLPFLHAPADFNWQKHTRKPFFVPESKMIDDLLREFQKTKIHIAVVVDEFGSMSGIITMEDILEEIVGDINDEFDEEERMYQQLDANTYLFEGKTPVEDFCQIIGVSQEDFVSASSEAETLAGLVLEIIDDFPTLHQRALYRNFSFEVMALDDRRISRVKVGRTKTTTAVAQS